MNIKKLPAYNGLSICRGFFVMQRVRKIVEGNLESGLDGTGITVAVLDTGVGAHPDLSGRLMCFRDFVYDRDAAYDDNGHGTHVCGILCGNGSLSRGKYRGMALGAGLVVGKVLDEKGDGETEAMLKGIDWILQIRKQYRIKILNISVGIGNLNQAEKEKALKNKLDELWESGILVICAAGNNGPGNGTISSVGGNRIVTVGCFDVDYGVNNPGRCELYSGRGILGSAIRKPDLVAPGTDIVSCNLKCCDRYGMDRRPYIAKSGTSMATPIVSGAVALMLQKYPYVTNAECKRKLQLTAVDLGLPWNQQGWGMLNVKNLLD